MDSGRKFLQTRGEHAVYTQEDPRSNQGLESRSILAVRKSTAATDSAEQKEQLVSLLCI